MMTIEELYKDFEQATFEIQMARTPHDLETSVIGLRYTLEQQYAQCVLEADIKRKALIRSSADVSLMEIKINNLTNPNIFIRIGRIVGKLLGIYHDEWQYEKTKLEIDLLDLQQARLGAKREFDTLLTIWATRFPKRYTRAELNDAQPEETRQRLLDQANSDIIASGRIGQGNQMALRRIGIEPLELIANFQQQLSTPQLPNPKSIERNYLETGEVKLLVAVPTEKQAIQGLPCVEGLVKPNGVSWKIMNMFNNPVDENYNQIVLTALRDNSDWLLTIEDDTFPPPDAIVKLIMIARDNPGSAVGAWYPKRQHPREGVHIVLKDGIRQAMVDDGTTQEAYTMAMGCALFPVGLFKKINNGIPPWFVTMPNTLSQDSYFSQLAREAGCKLLVDTSIKCRHIDRVTGEIFV